MPRITAIRRLILPTLAAVCLAGCQSAARPRVTHADGTRPLSLRERERLVEQRAEAQARFAAGLALELQGRPDEALESYLKSLQLDGGNGELALDVARRLIQLRRFDDARDVLNRALEENPESFELTSAAGELAVLGGNIETAEGLLLRARELAPGNSVAYLNLYRFFAAQEEYPRVLELLRNGAEHPDPELDLLLVLADLAINTAGRAGDETTRDSARALGEDLLDRISRFDDQLSTTGQLKVADAYRAIGEPDVAVRIFLEMLRELGPQQRVSPVIRTRLTRAVTSGREISEALEQARELSVRFPENAETFYLLGSLQVAADELEAGIEAYRTALALEPRFEAARQDLATTLANVGELEDARSELRTLLDDGRRNFRLRYLLALVEGGLENHEEAVTQFTIAEEIGRAEESDALDHQFYFRMGVHCERAKRYDECAMAFRRALALKPDFHEALNYLGYTWADLNRNLDEARELIERALELDPENDAYLDSMGWVLFRLGDFEEARRYIERAIANATDPDPTLYDHLGDVMQALNEPVAAAEAWRKSLELKDDPAVRRKLDPAGVGQPDQGNR